MKKTSLIKITLLSLVLLFACKKENQTSQKPNLSDTYSGKYVDTYNDTLVISLLSSNPDKNTYSLKGLGLMVKKNFNDSTTVIGNSHTGYATGTGSIWIDGIALASDGYSYVRFNTPKYLGYGNWSRTLIKIP